MGVGNAHLRQIDRLLTPNFLLLCAGSLFFHISFHSLLSTLPSYVLAIGGGKPEIGLIIGAFAASSLLFRIPVGWMLDRRGATKGLIITGTLIFLASAILYNFAKTVPTLLAVRLLHGSGIAAYTTAASTLVAHTTPAHRRGEAMGVFGMAATLSMGLGPVLGVFVLRAGSYHTLFVYCAICAAIGVLLATPLRDHATHREPQQGRHVIICKKAIFPSAIMFVACITYGVVVSFLPLFTTERHLGNAGSFFLVYALFLMVTRGPIGRISDKYGRAVVIAPGMALLAAAMLVLAPARSAETMAAAAAIYGLGFACVQPSLMALAIDGVKANQRGAAMGLLTAGFELGIAVGSTAFGATLASAGFPVMFNATAAVAGIGCAAFVVGHLVKRARAGDSA